MIRLLFTVTLFTCASTWATTGSVVREKCWHVGLRPAAAGEGAAVTVQLTTDFPVCPKEKP